MAAQLTEIDAIAGEKAPPSFANTIAALEPAGGRCRRFRRVFSCLAGAYTNDDIQALEREMSPRLAAHCNAIQLEPGLYAADQGAVRSPRRSSACRRAGAGTGAL